MKPLHILVNTDHNYSEHAIYVFSSVEKLEKTVNEYINEKKTNYEISPDENTWEQFCAENEIDLPLELTTLYAWGDYTDREEFQYFEINASDIDKKIE